MLALAALAVIATAGLWLIGKGPVTHGASVAAFLVSSTMFVTSLAIGLHLHLLAQASKRKAAQMEAQARAEAQRSAQARAALLGMVSHELRTPLQTMLANVELLALEPQSPDMEKLVRGLEQCIEQISGRLDDIAQYTRLANGHVGLRRDAFRLVPLLQRVVAEHSDAAKANDQVVNLDLPDSVDVQVHGDAIRLHQVLNNFLSNAVKYSGAGVIEVSARLISGTRSVRQPGRCDRDQGFGPRAWRSRGRTDDDLGALCARQAQDESTEGKWPGTGRRQTAGHGGLLGCWLAMQLRGHHLLRGLSIERLGSLTAFASP